MQLVLVIIYIAVAWHFLNFFQRKMGIFYFGKVSDYFVYKLIISLFLGWVIIPIGLIVSIIKGLSASKENK
jgi:hypothetical protein